MFMPTPTRNSLNTSNPKQLAKIGISLLVLILSACQPVASTTSEEEIRERKMLKQNFSTVTGFYEGHIETRTGELIPVTLSLFVGNVEFGVNEWGETLFRPALLGNLVNSSEPTGSADYFMWTRLTRETGDLVMGSKERPNAGRSGSGFLSFDGQVSEGMIEGSMTTHQGYWGELSVVKVRDQ